LQKKKQLKKYNVSEEPRGNKLKKQGQYKALVSKCTVSYKS